MLNKECSTFYCTNFTNKKPRRNMEVAWSRRKKKLAKGTRINNYEKIISKNNKIYEHVRLRCKENSIINNKLG